MGIEHELAQPGHPCDDRMESKDAEKKQTGQQGARAVQSRHDTPAHGFVYSIDAVQCGKAGKDYSLWLAGAYVDFSYDFDVAPMW